jgi:hypothetical protein
VRPVQRPSFSRIQRSLGDWLGLDERMGSAVLDLSTETLERTRILGER